MSRWPVARCRRRHSCCRSVPAAAMRGPGRRTPSRLRLLLCLIYQLGFRGVAIRVAEENGGAAFTWPSSAGWLRTSSRCASSRWAHLPVREGGVLLACALHVSGGPRVHHHGFIAHPTKQPYPPTAPTRWLELNYESSAIVFQFCACMSIASILLIDHRLQIYSPQDQGENSGYQFHYSGANLRTFIAADKIVAPSDKLPSKEFD
uniref:Uncharacterized protein n=1 Tax=Oryza barthii TaxID=65489 RepID=A0A0D3GPE2_9ORYZ